MAGFPNQSGAFVPLNATVTGTSQNYIKISGDGINMLGAIFMGTGTPPIPTSMVCLTSDTGPNTPTLAIFPTSGAWPLWLGDAQANLNAAIDLQGILRWGYKPAPQSGAPSFDTSLARIAPGRLFTPGDVALPNGSGVILRDTNGVRYRLGVSTAGALTVTSTIPVGKAAWAGSANAPLPSTLDTSQTLVVPAFDSGGAAAWTLDGAGNVQITTSQSGNFIYSDLGFSDFDASAVLGAYTNGSGLFARAATNDTTGALYGYLLNVSPGSPNVATLYIGPSFTSLGSWNLTGSGPWTLRMTGNGSQLTCYEGGVQKLQVSDATYVRGSYAIGGTAVPLTRYGVRMGGGGVNVKVGTVTVDPYL